MKNVEVAQDIMREAEALHQVISGDSLTLADVEKLFENIELIRQDLHALNLPKLVQRYNRRGKTINRLENQTQQANRRVNKARAKARKLENVILKLANPEPVVVPADDLGNPDPYHTGFYFNPFEAFLSELFGATSRRY